MRVDDLARVPLSFPTYTGILGRVAASAARQLNLTVNWQAHQAEMESKAISPVVCASSDSARPTASFVGSRTGQNTDKSEKARDP